MARYTLIAPDVAGISESESRSERSVICDVHLRAPALAREESTAVSPRFEVMLDGVASVLELLDLGPPLLFLIEGKPSEVVVEASGEYRVLGSGARLRVASSKAQKAATTSATPCLVAPMPGRIVRVLCQAGDVVEPGTPLVVLEAMKMENELCAPARGRVEEVFVREGSPVEARAKLVTLAEA
jgi:biotin carboxyl carrier protein